MATFESNNIIIKKELPLIALKNVVLFPRVAMPLFVQRSKSVSSLEDSITKDKLVVFVAQKNLYDDVKPKDLYNIGTVGKVFEVKNMPDGSFKIEVEGVTKVKIKEVTQTEPFFMARVSPLVIDHPLENESEIKVLVRSTVDGFKKIVESRFLTNVVPGVLDVLNQIFDPEQVANFIGMNLNLELREQQELLQTIGIKSMLKKINLFITRELEIIDTEKKVYKETKKQIGKLQKEMFLREQMKSIEKELGIDGEKSEFDALRAKVRVSGMPKEVELKAFKELDRLEKMPSFSPEISYIRTYLELLVDLPWNKKSKSKFDLKEAEKILNDDHYGLNKIKERIIEYLAVQKQVGKIKGSILCFVWPPGVGKTSIGRSIARAMGRKFVRMSLGGLRDEAE